jgi:hypothetical protein
MREIDRHTRVSRRVFLRSSATAVPAAAVAAAGMSITPDCAWAQGALNLQPATLATLAKAARDIYPHYRLPDSVYMKAVAGYDAKAADPKVRDLMEGGVARLNAEAQDRCGCDYIAIAEEADRVTVLHAVERTAFFRGLRADLVVSIYNQPAVWTKLGYEGPSADKGGYLHRGFNDIDWLSSV